MAENQSDPKKPKQDNPEQSQRFVETAKALESDEKGEAFLKVVKPVDPKKKPV